MLDTQISVRHHWRGTHVFEDFDIAVGRISGGAIAGYIARESSYDDGVRAEARLTGYPRWTEPERALVARAMGALWVSRPRLPIREFEAITEIRTETYLYSGMRTPRLLHSWCLEVRDAESGLLNSQVGQSVSDERTVQLRPYAYWRELVLQGQCLASWNELTLPPWPERLQIPIYRTGCISYVRAHDLPQLARGEFRRRMAHSRRPWLPKVPDAYFAEDWLDFLNG